MTGFWVTTPAAFVSTPFKTRWVLPTADRYPPPKSKNIRPGASPRASGCRKPPLIPQPSFSGRLRVGLRRRNRRHNAGKDQRSSRSACCRTTGRVDPPGRRRTAHRRRRIGVLLKRSGSTSGCWMPVRPQGAMCFPATLPLLQRRQDFCWFDEFQQRRFSTRSRRPAAGQAPRSEREQ